MSRESFSSNKGTLVTKLRDGLQETVVFLRTLGSYKIPAVIERRRKELLDKLCVLQGDTIRDPPPVIESIIEPPEEHPQPPLLERTPSVTSKREEREDTPSSTSSVTSPSHGEKISRRDSKIASLVKDYEKIHYKAKKTEVDETPKRMVMLKKVIKPTDFPSQDKPPPTEEGEKATANEEEGHKAAEGKGKKAAEAKAAETSKGDATDSSAVASKDQLEVDPRGERASSVMSMENGLDDEGEESEKGNDKKKKKGKKGFGAGVFSKRKRDKSPARPEKRAELSAGGGEEQTEPQKLGEEKEEEEEVQFAEGVKMCGVLERHKKKGIGHKKTKIDAKVFHTSLILGGKEELSLARCAVEETESGFELTHPQHRSAMTFKVDGTDHEKQKWVEAMKAAIAEATPAKEKEATPEAAPQEEACPSPDIPSITVNEIKPTTKRDSKVLNIIKAEKKLPDQGVSQKGYIYRKKPGIGRSWEKTYTVLTYQAMYFTNVEDNRDYSGMLNIYPDSDAKLNETKKGKGHDKHCQVPGLALKIGKKVEQFSFETLAEFRDWKDAIERVLGIGGVEELLSEDEELEEFEAIEEDLYEELELEPDLIPPVPASPRPARPSTAPAPAPVDDGILIDEDIYEDTDDYIPTMSPPVQPSFPSLPDRNPPKITGASLPSLPPRNAPGPVVALPPRNAPVAALPSLPSRNAMSRPSSVPSPQEYEATSVTHKKLASKPPAPSISDDEDLYDDVVVAGQEGAEVEDEMYDDVVVGQDGAVEEDLYDDVVTTTGAEPIQDEFYEDMAAGTPDPYVTMEKKGEGEEDGEDLYVDVEEPANKPQKPPQDALKQSVPKSSGTFSRMFPKKSVSGGKAAGMSGNVLYKAPKKSKFEGKWAAIEGSSLLVYKNSSDKRSQEKISLGDCRLELGSTEAGAGKYAFHLSKGDKVHHFSLKEAREADEWVGVVKGLVKYAPVTSEEVYQAKEDHIADAEGEITFKKGTYIRLISKESDGVWVGQIGNEEQTFEGKKGKFPADKVQIAEDLYF